MELRRRAMGPVHTAADVDQSPERTEARVRSNFDCAEIVEVNGRPIGLLKVVRSPTEWRVSQSQLLPEHQGKGIGTQLLQHVLVRGAKEVRHRLVLQPAIGLKCGRFAGKVLRRGPSEDLLLLSGH
jgi:GNAT superfamily N-acetyltransferase